MKKLLAVVKDNLDSENLKRIRVSLIGLTEGVPTDSLPYAYPLDDQCIVPEIHSDSNPSKVWVYLEKDQESEDYNYSRLYYRRFTEQTYKECYDLSNSDSYKIKNNNIINGTKINEPSIPSTTEYPKNKVIKFSGITVEFDSKNKRLEITDENGNYTRFSTDGIVLKSIKDLYNIIKGNSYIHVEGDTIIEDKNGNSIEINSGNIKITAAQKVDIQAATTIELGSNVSKVLCNNLNFCLFTGSPHSVGNTQVKV